MYRRIFCLATPRAMGCFDPTRSRKPPGRPDHALLRRRLREARSLPAYLDVFSEVFDARASCADNLRRCIAIFLRTQTPDAHEIANLSAARRNASDASGAVEYALTFLWLGVLNAHRIAHRIGRPHECCGAAVLPELRVCAPDLMAPTWQPCRARGRWVVGA